MATALNRSPGWGLLHHATARPDDVAVTIS
jgi:hypothetical protein